MSVKGAIKEDTKTAGLSSTSGERKHFRTILLTNNDPVGY
jgi:hypothetical protein